MRFSSSSASQILTKTKSQNQRDRSGRIAAHTGNGFHVKQSPSLSGKIESKVIRSYPRVTIKDLRLRRVFSPSSISVDWEFKTKGDNLTKEQNVEYPSDSRNSKIEKEGTKINGGGLGNGETEDLLKTTPPDSEFLCSERISGVNEADLVREEINAPTVRRSGTNLCSKSVLHPCSRAKIFKNPGSFSYKRLLPYLMQAADDGTSSGRCSKPEKSIGQNTPNINLSCDKEIGETAEDPKEEGSEMMTAKCQLPETTKPVLQPVDTVLNQHSAGSLCGYTSPLKRVIVSSPNKKSAYPWRKLFKTPGSVNYRRMLPYLRDTQVDNPCKPETIDHPDLQKIIEENTPSSMFVSENEGTQEMVMPDTARESVKESLPCEPLSPERSDLDMEQETQVKHVIPDTEKNLETPHNALVSEVPLPSPHNALVSEVALSSPHNALVSGIPLSSPHNALVSEVALSSPHNVLVSEVHLSSPQNALVSEVHLSSPQNALVFEVTSEVAKSALDNTFVDNVVGEESMNGAVRTEAKRSAEQLEADKLNLTAELVDTCVELGTPPSVSPSKGILRRSIRGCRGICSCLNCSSFRLNAERAFEFSRNQLQDTEVMVLDLVEEISHLRDMLVKYGSADHNESNKNQAGEASKRASEAAELAKNRLLQMNDDLQVHCRIPNEQRAKVKFAHYVQEKTILKASEPNNLTHISP
ncbi:hypothetical protein AALP_AA4G060900 [Arabis alpina]|uniref:Uncharacterized protein n=1 Tax=Arabis alpina TaxID=50452 RepID=A0A087H1G3_ARAAL|nr:hypothetical protein AALP_AA4G060900 [Arabis alpina]